MTAGVEIREPTEVELAAIYGGAEHYVGIVDGVLAAWVSFRAIDDRVWGMFGVVTPVSIEQRRQLFYAFRKILLAKNCVIHATASHAIGERLMRAAGLRPTGEIYADKKVFVWIPDNSTS